MKATPLQQAVLVATLCCSASAGAQTAGLQSPQAFDAIPNTSERSRALFTEMGKVIASPRCMNCHPQGDRPTQGETMRPHNPPIVRGVDGHGPPGLPCSTCHQAANFDPATVPGDPAWHLAPRSMAWQGQSLAQICVQLKDAKRNGGKTLAQIHEHMAKDSLVGWAWAPGVNRTPAPGTQAQFGELVGAWIATGAACPLA